MLNFGASTTAYTANPLSEGVESGGQYVPSLAIYWTDLETSSGTVSASNGNSQGNNLVYYYVDTESNPKRLIITWDDVAEYNDGAAAKLAAQIVLENAGSGDMNISYRYEFAEAPDDGSIDDTQGGWHVGGTAGGDEGVDWYEIPLNGNGDLGDLDTRAGNSGTTGLWEWELRDGGISPAGEKQFSNILEDPATNTGESVNDVFGDNIAVTSVDNSNGTWQYSLDGGSTWSNFDTPTRNEARLLDTGELIRFVPNTDWNGNLELEWAVWDGAGGSSGSTIDAAASANVGADYGAGKLTVTAVNDEPSFTKGADILADLNGGAHSYPGWATNINEGASDESGQTLSFNVSNDNNGAFTSQPAISSNGTLSFTPDANSGGGSVTVTVSLSDDGGTANGGDDQSPDQTFKINFNTPPTITSGDTFEADENQTVVCTVTASDNEGDNLTYSIPAGLSGSVDSTHFNIDSNTGELEFKSPKNYENPDDLEAIGSSDGEYSVSVSVTDDGAPNMSDTLALNVTLADVNDAPTGFDDSVSIAEGYPYSFKKNDFTYSDEDEDTMAAIKVIDVETDGDLEYDSGDVATNTVVATFDKFVFMPVPGENGSPYTTFTYKLKDQNGLYSNHIYTMTINVNEGDSPPSIDNSIADITVLEDADDYIVRLDTLFTDADNADSKILKSVSNNTDTTLISTAIDGDDLTLEFLENQNGSATITVQGLSNGINIIDSFQVAVTPVNDAPLSSDGDVTLQEDDSYTFKQEDFTYSDIETNPLAGIKIITLDSLGTLKYDGSDVQLDTTYSDLSKLTFVPDTNGYGSSYSGFTFKLKDAGGAYSDSVYQYNINVSAIDDPPHIANKINNIIVDEDSPATLKNLKNIYSDVDNSDDEITKSLLNNSSPNLISTEIYDDILKIEYAEDLFGTAEIVISVTSNNKSINDTVHVIVEAVNDAPFGGNDTVLVKEGSSYTFAPEDFTYSDIEEHEFDGIQMVSLVDAGIFTCYGNEVKVSDEYYPDVTKMVYTPAEDEWGKPYTSFQFRVRDKKMAFSDSVYTMTINVTKIDKPPTVNNPLQNVTVNEDAPNTEIILDSTFADPDDKNIAKTIHDNSDSSLVIATIVNDTLILDYKPDQYGNCNIVIQGESNNHTVNDTLNLTVNPVNDTPISQNNTISIAEESSYQFKMSDFYYFDQEGQSLAGIKITALETAGSLVYGGNDVSEDSDYPDIEKLVFTPENNETGAPYAEFGFQVRDSVGAYSDSTYVMTINVINVNDAPIFTTTFPDTTITENQLLEWEYNAYDPDQDTLVYGISAISIYHDNNWLDLPDFTGLAPDSSSGQVAFKPNYDQAGKYRVIFYVTDGQAPVSDTTTITVNNVNRKPEFTAFLTDTSITNDTELIFSYAAEDPDEDEIIFGLQDTIDGLVLSETGELNWTPPEQPKEEYEISIFATDNIDTVLTSAIVEVEDVVSISRIGLGIPDEYSLGHNYPNPFNPSTSIRFGLPERAKVNISVYDINGNLIEKILDNQKEAGFHKIIWNANNVSTGVYFYRIQTSKFTDVKKCILMK